MIYNKSMEKITGSTILITAMMLYGFMYPLLKRANEKFAPFTVMAISMFTLFIASLVLAIVFENGLKIKVMENKNLILMLLGVGLINTLSFWLSILGFKYMPIWQQTMFNLLTPVFAGIFAFLILKEPLSFKLLLGLLVMSAGLYIAVK